MGQKEVKIKKNYNAKNKIASSRIRKYMNVATA